MKSVWVMSFGELIFGVRTTILELKAWWKFHLFGQIRAGRCNCLPCMMWCPWLWNLLRPKQKAAGWKLWLFYEVTREKKSHRNFRGKLCSGDQRFFFSRGKFFDHFPKACLILSRFFGFFFWVGQRIRCGGGSYAELFTQKPVDVFVSHWWGHEFSEFVKALEHAASWQQHLSKPSYQKKEWLLHELRISIDPKLLRNIIMIKYVRRKHLLMTNEISLHLPSSDLVLIIFFNRHIHREAAELVQQQLPLGWNGSSMEWGGRIQRTVFCSSRIYPLEKTKISKFPRKRDEAKNGWKFLQLDFVGFPKKKFPAF